MMRGVDAAPYSGAAIAASPVTGLSTDDFVGNSDPDRRWDSTIPWAGGPITLSMWVLAPSAPSGNTQAVGFRDVTGNSVPYIGLNLPYNDGSIYWYYGPSWSYELTASYTAHIGKWTHVALDSDATDIGLNRIWIDGQLVASMSSSSGSPGVADTISIGASWSGSAWRSHWGRLADVRIYNRTLSAAEDWQLWAPQTRWQLLPARPTRRWFLPSSPSSTIFRRTFANVFRSGSRSVA